MKQYTKKEALTRMNQLGEAGKPFLFIVDYKQEQILLEEPKSIDSDECLYNLNGFTNVNQQQEDYSLLIISEEVQWKPRPITLAAYDLSFRKVMDHIRAGNSYLTNLTCATPIETNLSLCELFFRSEALYKVWLKNRFVLFSPEIFVRIHNGQIYSYPMKGTIDASLPNARECILSDAKEAAEHATIVDLIRNDLSMVAREVIVSNYRYIDELHTNRGNLLQVSSEITGKLSDDYCAHLGDILFRLLPAGSITGAPKPKTQAIIDEAETYQRGFYTGVTGYFDGQQLDSAVMIRFIEQDNGQLIFKSGGGITAQSNMEREYNEMIQKVYVPLH